MRRLPRLSEAAARAGSAVHGIGIGVREVCGRRTGDLAVRVYVIQKLPRCALGFRDRLPPQLDGIPVDVVECEPCWLNSGKRPPANPVASGTSTACLDVPYGTVAAFCRPLRPDDDRERILVLSNNHVLANLRGSPGDPIYQPGPADTDGPLNAYARLLRAWRIEPGTTPNQIDAAVATLDAGVEHDVSIPGGIGALRGTERARVNVTVCKFGRTSQYTEGVVTDLHCTETVGLDRTNPSHVARFVDQIRIDRGADFSLFADKGDSGSLVLETGTGRAVGLYFAGPISGRYGLANHIGAVLERLEIELLTLAPPA
jgi:hypothetical protein